MTVPFFAPLTSVHLTDPKQETALGATVIQSEGATAVIRTYSDGPVASHDLTLQCTDLTEVEALRSFFLDRLGACLPFWMPSYQRDFTLIGSAPVVCDSLDFVIQWKGYTDYEFPDPLRRNIVFVFGDGMLIRRLVTASVDNLDDTETLTLDEPIWREFIQQRNNGICYAWYGRFKNDTLKLQWIDRERAIASLSMIELRPFTAESEWFVFTNLVSYLLTESAVFGIHAVFNGGIGEAGGYAYGQKDYALLPNHTYTISGLMTINRDSSPYFSGIHITTDGDFLNFDNIVGTDVPFSSEITTGSDGLLNIKIGLFQTEFGEAQVNVEVEELTFETECM